MSKEIIESYKNKKLGKLIEPYKGQDQVDMIFGESDAEKAAFGITIGISLIPVVGQVYDVFQAITMGLDMADLYGFSKVYTRESINKLTDLYISSMENGLNSESTKNMIRELINNNPDIQQISKEGREKIINNVIKLVGQRYSIAVPKSIDEKKCYENSVIKTGKPSNDCDEPYRKEYYKYYNDNLNSYKDKSKDERKKEVINNNTLLLEKSNIIDKEIKKDSNVFRIIIGLLIFLIVIFFVFLIRYLFNDDQDEE